MNPQELSEEKTVSNYADPDSQDYRETNVGLGMVPEKKTKAMSENPVITPAGRLISYAAYEELEARLRVAENGVADLERELAAMRLGVQMRIAATGLRAQESELKWQDALRELTALRLRYTWKPMKDAPMDHEVLLNWSESRAVATGWAQRCTSADGWMEIP